MNDKWTNEDDGMDEDRSPHVQIELLWSYSSLRRHWSLSVSIDSDLRRFDAVPYAAGEENVERWWRSSRATPEDYTWQCTAGGIPRLHYYTFPFDKRVYGEILGRLHARKSL